MLSHLTHLTHPLTTLNTLLQHLGLRRTAIWNPPTLLDSLLTSPLQYLLSLLYRYLLLPLRGRPFHPPRHRRPIRVVCLSDTHSLTLPASAVPAGDVLIHCGDLTVSGSREEVQSQVDWLSGFGHRWKIVVGGNHDGWLEEKEGKGVEWRGVEYLCGRGVEVVVEGGRRLNIYGWGGVPWVGEGHA